MTRRQRRILAATGATALIIVMAVGVAALTGSGKDAGDRLAVQGRSEEADDNKGPKSTETTYALVPVTTGVPIPDATERPPPTSSPSASPAAPRAAGTAAPPTAPGLTGDGAVLTRPATAPPPRPIDKSKGCHSTADPGWTVKECGALKTGGMVLIWVVETRGTGTRVLVMREQTAGQWTVVLSAADDAGTAWSSVGVRGEDVSGDGQPDLAFGFHRRTPDKVLAVDIVEAPSVSVTLHRELPGGSARVAKGELGTWAAQPSGAFEHARIAVVSGAWRIVASETVQRSAVPPSMI